MIDLYFCFLTLGCYVEYIIIGEIVFSFTEAFMSREIFDVLMAHEMYGILVIPNIYCLSSTRQQIFKDAVCEYTVQANEHRLLTVQ